MASASIYLHDGNYRDENARRTPGLHCSRITPDERSGRPRVRLVTQGEETVIQGTDIPTSPVRSFREDGNDMSFLDDIALLRRGYINKSSTKRNSPNGTAASEPINSNDRPITLAELESRGLNINGKIVYTLPRGTKYSSKARPPLPPLASADSSSTSRSWIPSTSGSDASVAALVNESKKPNVKTGDLQRLPDGTIVEKIALDKERVRVVIRNEQSNHDCGEGQKGFSDILNSEGTIKNNFYSDKRLLCLHSLPLRSDKSEIKLNFR
ncbi:hypothetical protein PRIPAC_77575, partial [Pristionchus pacificus]